MPLTFSWKTFWKSSEKPSRRKMAHFPNLDEKHPYLAIAAIRMSEKPEDYKFTAAKLYWKLAAFHFIHNKSR